jgi:hypothetical protein
LAEFVQIRSKVSFRKPIQTSSSRAEDAPEKCIPDWGSANEDSIIAAQLIVAAELVISESSFSSIASLLNQRIVIR